MGQFKGSVAITSVTPQESQRVSSCKGRAVCGLQKSVFDGFGLEDGRARQKALTQIEWFKV